MPFGQGPILGRVRRGAAVCGCLAVAQYAQSRTGFINKCGNHERGYMEADVFTDSLRTSPRHVSSGRVDSFQIMSFHATCIFHSCRDVSCNVI